MSDDNDSDNENDNETEYERLFDDNIETTVLVHSKLNTDDDSDDNDDDNKTKIEKNLKKFIDKKSDTKIHISLSEHQIILVPKNIKKSPTEPLISPLTIKHKFLDVIPVVYDVPRKLSVPVINHTPIETLTIEQPTINPITSSLLPPTQQPISLQIQTGISRFLEQKYKCAICKCFYVEPRVLDCLHSFCLKCLSDLEMGRRNSSENSDVESNFSVLDKTQDNSQSDSVSAISHSGDLDSKSSINYGRRRSLVRQNKERGSLAIPRNRTSSIISYTDKQKTIKCPICESSTDLPVGGINRLPFNHVLARKTQMELVKIGSKSNTTYNLCNLCSTEVFATFKCVVCNIDLCQFCKDAHARQLLTFSHEIKTIIESGRKDSSDLDKRKTLKCPIHVNHDLKLFCTSCHQVICTNCTIIIHRGHKYETITKASKFYIKLIKNSLEKTRPLSDYATYRSLRLNGLSKKINQKCDFVLNEVEVFLTEYFQALEAHRSTLATQIARARDDKIEIIRVQKQNLEKRSICAKKVIQFSEELLTEGSDVEILSFIGLLLKRFEECQNSKESLDPKISDSLQFLPDIKAPSTKAQNNIPLFGIITTQTAKASFCTLETKGLMNFRVHRNAELLIISRDSSDRPLCHGGLVVRVELKYKNSARLIHTKISDKRDGTYIVSFVPDTAGLLNLAIMIQEKQIKDSPFILCVRTIRPHSGIYHCCTFCSTGGSKTMNCACPGTMDCGGYQGCGHGHQGHPGRRHWSCCANVLENSECSKANVLVNDLKLCLQ